MIPSKCAKAAAAVDNADIEAIERGMKAGGDLRAAVEGAITQRTAELTAYTDAAKKQHPDAFTEVKPAEAPPAAAEAASAPRKVISDPLEATLADREHAATLKLPPAVEQALAEKPMLTVVNEAGAEIPARSALLAADIELAQAKEIAPLHDVAVGCILRG